jgi:hypothetical protein
LGDGGVELERPVLDDLAGLERDRRRLPGRGAVGGDVPPDVELGGRRSRE